ncbi:bifunctional phosphoribosyl-AMP cyclohydrolase/phosphoribosyl-ATP diphosphatase HisIE [Anoxynatronum buryatiense]|uniref:Histidine biosynthesis bifunctional protein HisIE n=1 Tax=Anoxynatronum buryatiense TaxID=489973 RepID=A0AA45WW34_9CLOT|nr:bifunctional phosphoribosyl-AMP cyclohydrolase/phosphoribosyl-ATP diphosphatase HisIE [Anoxynatronum buryatiense]SMP54967.1 phosphoribosyl-ATP pyrophosphatase /phosphoribosyl-AMP cyclohydrolase [Anoxynatronum buryatiense]
MKMDLETLTYNDQGLIPAIVQEAGTGEVLMMAYMNRESLEKTLETGETWFYSRSRQQLWHKGETSGHVQQVQRVQVDCDEDTLLVTVTQTGAACHTGEKSCFYRDLDGSEAAAASSSERDEPDEKAQAAEKLPASEDASIIRQIVDTLAHRRRYPKEGSYTNYLFDKGIDKILKKVGEESAEIIIAAKNPDKEELVYEISDLVYHVLVLMNERQVTVEEVLKELGNRHGR